MKSSASLVRRIEKYVGRVEGPLGCRCVAIGANLAHGRRRQYEYMTLARAGIALGHSRRAILAPYALLLLTSASLFLKPRFKIHCFVPDSNYLLISSAYPRYCFVSQHSRVLQPQM
ncbi:uncharacterized protein PHALS_04454 [Plasmopara halstedii]|uniref:Uncharacterized protein n=1 Tax=Plasmopara halstedii TaxID=4781 RepID=A0A0P1A8U6_PLAHL|nr:uncharacterized protein PHALS_04454 [Plasmopara halstedii]CEG36988.1 hypothetical protein PHALS_04454 [Plasmopara halstedii]|eukprot:XP_024573357.1 hypothetical protein PHALS_04454 [Plasmopara halstedii]